MIEFCEKGSLANVITNEDMNLSLKFKILTDICRGMNFLHGKGIIHRDLKCANVLVCVANVSKQAIID